MHSYLKVAIGMMVILILSRNRMDYGYLSWLEILFGMLAVAVVILELSHLAFDRSRK